MRTTTRPQRSQRWVPLALIAIGALPVVAGTLRLAYLAGGPPVLPLNPRISASPAPAVIHVISAIPYLVVGAFHFPPAVRALGRGWAINLTVVEYVIARSRNGHLKLSTAMQEA